MPLQICDAPKTGDHVSLARLVRLEFSAMLREPLFALELQERVFAQFDGVPRPVIPGKIESGGSGSPALAHDGHCFFGVVSGSLVVTQTSKEAIRRIERVVLIEPEIFIRLR